MQSPHNWQEPGPCRRDLRPSTACWACCA